MNKQNKPKLVLCLIIFTTVFVITQSYYVDRSYPILAFLLIVMFILSIYITKKIKVRITDSELEPANKRYLKAGIQLSYIFNLTLLSALSERSLIYFYEYQIPSTTLGNILSTLSFFGYPISASLFVVFCVYGLSDFVLGDNR